jgi:hypothetical protein
MGEICKVSGNVDSLIRTPPFVATMHSLWWDPGFLPMGFLKYLTASSMNILLNFELEPINGLMVRTGDLF